MPWNPATEYRGDRYIYEGIAGAGNALGTGLQSALAKYEKLKQQSAFNDTVVDALKDVPGAMTPEQLARYHSAGEKEKNGIVLGAQFNAAQGIARQEQARRQQELQLKQDEQNFAPSDEERAIANRAGGELVPTGRGRWGFQPYPAQGDKNAGHPQTMVADDGTVIRDIYYVPGANQIVKANERKSDSWEALNKDVHAMSGAPLGDWQRAVNKRLDPATGEFVADLPKSSAVIDGKNVMYEGKTLRMPGSTYAQFLTRFNGLSGGPQAPATSISAGVTVPGDSGASAPPAAGVGGYIPGRRYAGKTYLGGDPNLPDNWR